MYFMMYAANRGLLARLTGQSTIAHLTAVKLKTLEVPVPNYQDQENILMKIAEIEETMGKATTMALTSKEMKFSLINSLLDKHNVQ